MLPKLICIVGPTASGKTDLGIRLAQEFNGEVISADSRQIYRELDIGTAKPYLDYDTVEHLHKTLNAKHIVSNGAIGISGIPHYCVDIVDPTQEYTVAEFQEEVKDRIHDIVQRKKIPFLVGGTGLYVRSLVDNFSFPRIAPDPELRKQLEHLLEEKGIEELYLELLKLDPKAADIVQSRNPRRIIRALEVCLKTGKPFTTQRRKGRKLFNTLQIGINWPREELYARVAHRNTVMIEGGLLDEVQALLKKYSFTSPAFSSIHYPEAAAHLQGTISFDEMMRLMNRNDRRFTRKQMIWFRRDERIHWIHPQDDVSEMVKKFLGK